MKTVLVTGATGFLGSALVAALLEKGWRVIGIGRKSKGFLSDATLHNPQFTLCNLDLTKDFTDDISGYVVDTIFHLAAKQPTADVGFEEFYLGNVQTTLTVIQYAKRVGVSQVVYSSTLSVFGKDPGGCVLTEEIVPTPSNYYGLTKYIAERLLEIELSGSTIQATVVRFPSLFGRNHLGGLLYTYYQLAHSGKSIEVYGRGEAVRNALYVDNAIDILLRVAERREALASFEVFLAGSAHSLPMARIAEHVRDCLHSSSKVILIDKPSSSWDMNLNMEKAKQLLGFESMTLDDGIKKYIKDMLIHV